MKKPSNVRTGVGNTTLILGAVFLGAGLILWMRSRSQGPVSYGPALTVYPSTEADQSTVENIIQALHALNGGIATQLPAGGSGSSGGSQGGSSTPPPSQTGGGNPFGNPPGSTPVGSPFGYHSPFTDAAGIVPGTSATPSQSNDVWSRISAAVNGLRPGASVQPLNIQGNAVVANSAAPEQTATKEQYQALVLGQFQGGTGSFAPGASVDVSQGYSPQLKQYTVQYLEGIIQNKAYNPDLPAIGNQQAVASQLYSMTNDPKYLTPTWTGQRPGVQ